MRSWILLAAALFVAGCSSQKPEITTIEPGKEPLKVHPLEQDPDYLADKKTKESKDKQRATPAKKEDFKLDPAILGEYRLELESEQERQIEAMITKMEADAAAGDPDALRSLPLAKQVRAVTKNMVVTLRKDMTYEANLGSGVTSGSFRPSERGVILTPSTPSNDPADPVDVEFIWNKTKQIMTVEFQGRAMKFEKKS